MQKHDAVLVADSAKPIQAIIKCISVAWMAAKMTPNTITRPNGVTLVVAAPIPLLVVDIDARPTGAHVEMRRLKTIWSKANRRQVERVRACL